MNSYKRIAPHLQRVLADGGAISDNGDDLRLLQNRNEQYKDYLKLAFCPELYGNKIRTSSNVNYLTKGYGGIVEPYGQTVFKTNFESGLSVCSPYNNTTLTNEGNCIKVKSNGNIDSGIQFTANLLTAGKTYELKIGFKKNSSYNMFVGFCISGYSNTYGNSNVAINNNEMQYYTYLFTANNSSATSVFRYAQGDDKITDSFYVYSISIQEVLSNDLYQSIDTSQPYLDKIAPAEKLSVKNPSNSGNKYLNHPIVRFDINQEFTIELKVLWYGNAVSRDSQLVGGGYRTRISFDYGSSNNILISPDSDEYFIITANKKPGKIITLHVTRASNGSLSTYIDGILINTTMSNYVYLFQRIFCGWEIINSPYTCYSNIYSYHIFSKAFSDKEVAESASILNAIFPEIPFTRIGDQIWSVRNFEAVVTPQGNMIPEMQASSNVEKIINGGFNSDTDWNKQAGWSISGGVATSVNGEKLYQGLTRTNNKWYKVSVTISNYISGYINIALGWDGNILSNINSNGTFIGYKYTSNPGDNNIYINGISIFNGSIDNLSIQEVGWSDSQNLYDYVYANTSGTVEQKTYAAVKAAAMWCHYNNDSALGAIYGKLYNWFAVKLLQMDIDYYNAANPTTPWGWRVPTQADFQTLSATLGGDAVSGGKLKKEGTIYWNSPNTGATNESGFSAIGAGLRGIGGDYISLNNNAFYYKQNQSFFEVVASVYSSNNNISTNSQYGFSLRLIKS